MVERYLLWWWFFFWLLLFSFDVHGSRPRKLFLYVYTYINTYLLGLIFLVDLPQTLMPDFLLAFSLHPVFVCIPRSWGGVGDGVAQHRYIFSLKIRYVCRKIQVYMSVNLVLLFLLNICNVVTRIVKYIWYDMIRHDFYGFKVLSLFFFFALIHS